MNFPEREQLNHEDIYPGMMFFFVREKVEGDKPLFTDPNPVFWESETPWTVIGKEYVPEPRNAFVGHWRFLLLGASARLAWHEGKFGWIRRIADPVWEERQRTWERDRLDAEVRRA